MQASREFLAELKVLTHVHHLNLVRGVWYYFGLEKIRGCVHLDSSFEAELKMLHSSVGLSLETWDMSKIIAVIAIRVRFWVDIWCLWLQNDIEILCFDMQVRLIGYCVEGSLFLVFEFIENGNLSQHLHGSGNKVERNDFFVILWNSECTGTHKVICSDCSFSKGPSTMVYPSANRSWFREGSWVYPWTYCSCVYTSWY